MEKVDQYTNDEMDGVKLLDCYRIALDFGMPAALRAYEKLSSEDSHIEKQTEETSFRKITNAQ